jgi:hypothetical protein
MAPSASQFEELQGRLRGLLIEVGGQLPRVTVQLVGEMIDANECGVALETISEMLADSHASITADVVTDVAQLAETMGLPPANADRLRPLVAASDDGSS